MSLSCHARLVSTTVAGFSVFTGCASFSYCTRDPRDLHSFPTRRFPIYTVAGVACTASLRSDRPKKGEHRIHVAAATAAGEDRKSTRLNSSHTVISYAVFCLKKKKISTRSKRLVTRAASDDHTVETLRNS